MEVLDPACGSGNFLYLTLRSLLDLEKQVIDFAATQGWDNLTPTVKPDQMLGLEINPYAAELARTALWIGYIQWHQNNGFPYNQRPILTPLVSISKTDAILAEGDIDNPQEPEWPPAEFIIGNPPFLGSLPFRRQLGDEYTNAVYSLYGDRIPNSSDLCCYWFENQPEPKSKTATPAAPVCWRRRRFVFSPTVPFSHASRKAATSLPPYQTRIGYSTAQRCISPSSALMTAAKPDRTLDGQRVSNINADLTAGLDLTQAKPLDENLNISFAGDTKHGPFEISDSTARKMLGESNPHGKPNSDVVKPWLIGRDINQKSRNRWIIDFGVNMQENDAALYEAPFEYILAKVKPERDSHRDLRLKKYWWLHGRPRIEMRQALKGLSRYIVTSQVSSHRFFSHVDGKVLPDKTLVVFARDDDYFFGVLHSRVHEVWVFALGTQLREAKSGLRYIISTCFETFPFPEPTSEQREAVAKAARELNRLREGWLNPPNAPESVLKKRTLTNLYNARPTWLQQVHERLDKAVSDAYGWPPDLPDAAILERLLVLNLARAEAASRV